MTLKRPDSIVRYGAVTQALHWVTAILVLLAYIYGPGGSEQRVYSAARDFDRQLHETLGMCVFVLVVMRVLWRTIDRQPAPSQVPRWMNIVAKAVQWALYLLLFALPLLAALYHHIVLNDGVLASMLPQWFPLGKLGPRRSTKT